MMYIVKLQEKFYGQTHLRVDDEQRRGTMLIVSGFYGKNPSSGFVLAEGLPQHNQTITGDAFCIWSRAYARECRTLLFS